MMTPDSGNPERARELKLEGPGLVVAGVVLVAVLFGAFFLGRNYERGLHPDTNPAASSANSASAEFSTQPEASEVDQGNFFDTVEGDDKQSEPSREIPARASKPDAPRSKANTALSSLPAPDGDEFWVQVFAGRDERTAAEYVRKLESEGHTVRLFTEREGSGSLYKVRVGAWAQHGTAGRAAEALKKQGYTGSWVTRSPS